MITMDGVIGLTLNDGQPTRCVVEQQLEDGREVLRPETELEAIHREHGSRPLTEDELRAFFAEHGPHMLAPDDEG